jgi:putative intracellular protease/amidase
LASVLIPTPSVDFDPSEVALSWQVLTQAGHTVVFATPDGRMARGDDLMLTGEGLDPWGLVPGFRRVVVVGRFLRADPDARAAYWQMANAAEFRAPIRWDEINLAAVDGVLLPGGHRARGMRRYLESELLQGTVVEAFGRRMPVAAICHGVLLAARSVDPGTRRSVLYGRKTTGLTWSLERRAWHVARITRFWDPAYYRTYDEQPGQPAGYMSVQAEVTRALAATDDFQDVSRDEPDSARKTSGRYRDTLEDERPAFVVQDGSYISARWPGDVHTFAKRFATILRSKVEKPRTPAQDLPRRAPRAPSHPARPG